MYKDHQNRLIAYKNWKRAVQTACEEFGFSIETCNLNGLIVVDTLSLKAYPLNDSDLCDPLLADERAKDAKLKKQQKGEEAYNSIMQPNQGENYD